MSAEERLAKIGELLPFPCLPPSIANGYDRCTCGSGQVWPCNLTRAAWLAAGLDPLTEMRKVTARVLSEMAEYEEEG